MPLETVSETLWIVPVKGTAPPRELQLDVLQLIPATLMDELKSDDGRASIPLGISPDLTESLKLFGRLKKSLVRGELIRQVQGGCMMAESRMKRFLDDMDAINEELKVEFSRYNGDAMKQIRDEFEARVAKKIKIALEARVLPPETDIDTVAAESAAIYINGKFPEYSDFSTCFLEVESPVPTLAPVPASLDPETKARMQKMQATQVVSTWSFLLNIYDKAEAIIGMSGLCDALIRPETLDKVREQFEGIAARKVAIKAEAPVPALPHKIPTFTAQTADTAMENLMTFRDFIAGAAEALEACLEGDQHALFVEVSDRTPKLITILQGWIDSPAAERKAARRNAAQHVSVIDLEFPTEPMEVIEQVEEVVSESVEVVCVGDSTDDSTPLSSDLDEDVTQQVEVVAEEMASFQADEDLTEDQEDQEDADPEPLPVTSVSPTRTKHKPGAKRKRVPIAPRVK